MKGIFRPLDFAAVTDHAEYMGQARLANLDVPTNQRPLRELLLEGNPLKITIAWAKSTGSIGCNTSGAGHYLSHLVFAQSLAIDTMSL